MNRFPLYIMVFALLGCDSNKAQNRGNEVVSVQIQILPSFGERAIFKVSADSQMAFIQEDWRLSDSVGVLHQCTKTDQVDLQEYKINDLLGIDTHSFSSNCQDFDGWRLKGEIKFRTIRSFNFDYQDCYYDTTAHQVSKFLLDQLMKEFKQDTVTSDYLFEIYHRYYQATDMPLDSHQLSNRPLTKLRQRTIKNTGPNNAYSL